MRRARRVLRRNHTSNEALGEIAAAGIEATPDAAELAGHIEPGNNFSIRIYHTLRCIVARTTLRVRDDRPHLATVKRWRVERMHRGRWSTQYILAAFNARIPRANGLDQRCLRYRHHLR